MNTNLTLKFDFQTDSTDCAYSLMNIDHGKIEKSSVCVHNLNYIEVNLFTAGGSNGESKTAFLR